MEAGKSHGVALTLLGVVQSVVTNEAMRHKASSPLRNEKTNLFRRERVGIGFPLNLKLY